jgi:NADH-quinone oxidoreductase subunit E
VYTQPPARQDDLTRIRGIVEPLENQLHALGVYTYQQIMDWDTAAASEYSRLLSCSDSIAREGWIEQAARLHRQLYGRAA